MKRLLAILLVVFLSATAYPDDEWYPVNCHSHTDRSDGKETPEEHANTVRSKLNKLRPDGKCAMIVTDHFAELVDYVTYPDAIRATSITDKFIAIPGVELNTKWHPEAKTVANSHMLAIGVLPPNYPDLASCYDSGRPLSAKFDQQQKLIDGILALGMLPVAAHPSQLIFGGSVIRSDMRFNMKSDLRGLRAVEMFNNLGPGQDEECVNFYLRLLASGQLVFVTSGSDHHGTTVSTIPEYLLGSLERITWVCADNFSEKSILRAISEGKTYAACKGAFFYDFLTELGSNPGLTPTGVDQVKITAQAWLTGTRVKIIVYRDGLEATRQEYEYRGDLTHQSDYTLDGGNDLQNGWIDTEATVGSVHSYVTRVVATTKLGEQTLLITSPAVLRLRLPELTAAFFNAIRNKDLATLRSLLAADRSLANSRHKIEDDSLQIHSDRPTALSFACAAGDLATVRLLLDGGARTNSGIQPGEQGPLMEIAAIGDREKCLALLEYGADINLSTDGNTALCWAISHGHVELARLLIEKGADVNHPDDNWHRPLTLARIKNLAEIVKMLVAKGAQE